MTAIDNKTNIVSKQIIQFFAFTFIFSFLMWAPGLLHTYGLINPGPTTLKIMEAMKWIGGIGPSLVAFILCFKYEGKKGVKLLFNRLFKVKLGYWYIPIFLYIPAVVVLAHLINMWFFGAEFPKTGILSEPWMILPLFMVFFIMQISEEYGWRGYALDRLQTKYTALTSSLIIGVLWALWHLPMFLSLGFGQYENHLPYAQMFITLLAVSVLITWLQNNSKGSLIPAFVIHSLINMSSEVLPLISKSEEATGNYTVWVIVNILSIIGVIIIIAVWGKKTLTRNNL